MLKQPTQTDIKIETSTLDLLFKHHQMHTPSLLHFALPCLFLRGFLFHARHLFEANAKRQTPNAKRKIPTQEQGEAIANFSKDLSHEMVNCLFMWSMPGDDVESPICTLAQVLSLIHSFE